MKKLFAVIVMLLSTWLSVAHAEGNYVSQGGLTWMPITFESGWDDANRYCNTTINSQNGWRMPTIDELKAFYDSGAIKSQNLAEYNTVWSSTRGGSGHFSMYLAGRVLGHLSDNFSLHVSCVHDNSVTPTPATQPVQATSSTTPTGSIQLRADNSAAERAARERATAEANRKLAEEANRERLAREKQLADERRAREEAEAKRRAAFTIETRTNDSGQLSRRAAETYCQDSIARLRGVFSTGRNQLISVGACNCNTPNPALEATYCKYSYTYKQFETAER